MLSGHDMLQDLHRHDFFFVLALEKGAGHHEIDFTPYNVRDNSIFFMRPGQVHQLTLKAESTGYLLGFKKDFYPHDELSKQMVRKASSKNLCQPDNNSFKKLLSILLYIFQEDTHKQERYQEVIKANLDIFFIELARNHQSGNTLSNRTHKQERLEEFLELLEMYIADHRQVSHYADILNLSSYQLNGITKATLGKTASEIIDEHLILESKRYLLTTTNQVTQIAYHLGYEDVSYFIRFFKKNTGYSPEAFRGAKGKSH